MKRITIIALMSIMFFGQSYAQNKQNEQSNNNSSYGTNISSRIYHF